MLRNLIHFFRELFQEFVNDNILKYSASLAYYTVLSLAPMLILILKFTGIFWGEEALRGELYDEIKDLVGADAAVQIQNAIQNIHLAKDNIFATAIGIVVLIIGATGIFGEIQDSLNRIWGLKIKTRKVWWKLLFDRLRSFSLILSLGFVLIVSLILNALVARLSTGISRLLKIDDDLLLLLSDNMLSFLIVVLLFATIFKVLPDARIKWRDVFTGSIITAVLFSLGKYAIGFYLGKSAVASIYGAAGSIMILMIWVYYSAAILYLGAIITKVYATHHGGKIWPNEYAVWIRKEEVPVSDVSLQKNT